MSVWSGARFTLLLSLLGTGTLRAQEPLTDVRLVATDTLRDVAITRLEGDRPVIYYNPALIERVGPLLRDFFIAHEYGHVFFAHTGGALAGRDSASAEVRQRQELEADCYAANRLARTSRTSVEAAIAFFTRMGLYSHDRFHPSGASRAANLLACLPPASSETLAVTRPRGGDDVTTIEQGPMPRGGCGGSCASALTEGWSAPSRPWAPPRPSRSSGCRQDRTAMNSPSSSSASTASCR